MNLDDALHTFVVEARELLEQMEEALLDIERGQENDDTINAIFRAAHTIKGSAGLFGLDHIVGFTHVAENVLDKIRGGKLSFNIPLLTLMLSVCDHLNTLMEHVAAGTEPGEDDHVQSRALSEQLQGFLDGQTHAPATASMPAEKTPQVESEGGGEVGTDYWHISLRFGPDLLRSGMDPLSFIRYLATLGRIVSLYTIVDAIPRLSELDPETCYLGFEIAFESEADKSAIEGVFDFVREDSQIRILPPHSKITEYVGLIAALPEDEMRLGDILVKCGTLTPAELDQALQIQSSGGKEQLRPIGEVLVEQSMVQAPVVEAALEKQKQIKESKGGESTLIRVDSSKLDQLINLVGELIIVNSSASLIAQRTGLGELQEVTSTMARMVEEVRDSALSLRMVQIGATFNRFQRVVRDVSKELGKDIRLEISGAETELDKTIVEKIADPLTHLVRNSMDHGIEPAEVRTGRGKPEYGTLKLNAYHDSGSIVIEVSDDGGGLNRDKILAKAVERGLVSPDAVLSDTEIYNLIFEAGFSTADKISNLSGRGVGMDVVRRNIQALRGTIELHSEAGYGSTTRIRLPLTLAIIDGFLVGVGDASYVVPLDMVVECIELTREARQAAGDSERGYLNLRGEVLPYLRLREQFEVDGRQSVRENVVVVQYAGNRAGLVVDELLGEFQTVIKPLGKMFGGVRGIGGFTILGSGEVALILDVPRLMQQAGSSEQQAYAN
ncbi:MAG: chemotaxis protein CheA [Pseudomonadota bacterium]